MDLQRELENICKDVPGCQVAVLMNLDGMVVVRHSEGDSKLDDEVLLVELVSSLKQAIQAVASVDGGELSEWQIDFAQGIVVVRLLRDEHFVAMLLNKQAYPGKARYVMRCHSQPLIQDLF